MGQVESAIYREAQPFIQGQGTAVTGCYPNFQTGEVEMSGNGRQHCNHCRANPFIAPGRNHHQIGQFIAVRIQDELSATHNLPRFNTNDEPATAVIGLPLEQLLEMGVESREGFIGIAGGV